MNKRTKNKRKLILQVLTPTLISISLLIYSYFFLIDHTRSLLMNEKKQQSEEMINSLHSVINEYCIKVERGEIPESEAQNIIKDIIYNSRYGKDEKNYFWIINYNQEMISHPYFIDYLTLVHSNPNYANTMQTMGELAQKHGEIFYEYKWQWKDDASRIELKTSYLKNIPQWKWLIGTGFYHFEVEENIKSLTRYLTILLITLICLIISLYIIIIRKAFKDLKYISETDQELINSERLLRNMANQVNSGLIILEDHKVVYSNEMASQIFEDNIQNKSYFSVYDYAAKDEIERIKQIRNNNFKEGKTEIAFGIITPTKKRKYINNRFTHAYRDNIKITYILVSNITEYILKENQLKISSQTIDQSPDSTIITDLNGKILYVNKTFCKVSGYTIDEIVGKKPSVLKSDKMSPKVYEDLWETISKGKTWKKELLNKKKDGTLLWEYTIIFPILDENKNIIYYAAIKRDLTQQKIVEQELKEAKEKGDIGIKIKNAFLSNVSHEVNTPLNVISGFTNILLNELSESEHQITYLKNIQENTDILIKLFNDIMDFTAIESGNIIIDKKEILLIELIDNICKEAKGQAKHFIPQKNLNIVSDIHNNFENAILNSDIEWITRIFNELINNAIKFSYSGTISIGYKIDYENITFYVKDQGIGISKKDQGVIFKKFIHGNKEFVSLHKGTGLGLPIAKLLVEKLNGKIWYESKEDVGSSFYFSFSSINVKNYQLNNIYQTQFPYSDLLQNQNVLILEENDLQYDYILNMFTNKNTSISRAKNSIEFTELCNNIKFNLIILDYNFAYNEFGNLEASLKSINNSAIIITKSTHSSVDNIILSYCDGILTKPFYKNELYSEITKALERVSNN